MNDFFALLFEFFGTVQCSAADDLYNYVYVSAGFALLLFTLLWTAMYYQGFFIYKERAKYDTVSSWAIWGLLSSLFTTLIIWVITISRFNAEDVQFGFGDYIEFLCLSFFWAIILYFLFSIGMKYTNQGRKKIPF